MLKDQRMDIYFIDRFIEQLYSKCYTDEEVKNTYDEIKLINLKYAQNTHNKKRDTNI